MLAKDLLLLHDGIDWALFPFQMPFADDLQNRENAFLALIHPSVPVAPDPHRACALIIGQEYCACTPGVFNLK